MEDLIQRISAAAGIEPDQAARASGLILQFLQKEGPPAEIAKVMEKIPGAQALIDQVAPAAGSGSLLGGIMGMGGGLMGLAGQLTDAGLGMSQMQAVGQEVFAYAREKAGEDLVGEIVAAIPGLGQFV
jgi:hypothetical protein